MNKSGTASPLSRNLTGIPRKLRDNCAEWHNQIQRWNQLTIDGLDVMQQIADYKLAKQVSDQEAAENLGRPSAPCFKLKQLCENLQEILDKMVEHVEAMTLLTEQFEQTVSLWSVQQTYKLSVSQEDEASSDLPFQTWAVDNFWKVSKEMSDMYVEEIQSKRCVLENISHVTSKDELVCLMAVWEHEPYLRPELKLHLEAMLTETKHR